jgi:TonB-linked outer membrane protein, SusC/RagA family
MQMRRFLLLGMVLCFSLYSLAQTKLVSGKVVDSKGNPVEGATIQVESSKHATSSNPQGEFKIHVKSGDVLLISAINSKSIRIKVGGQDFVTATLSEFVSGLDEVIVTASGNKTRRKEQGYNATVVSGQEVTASKPTTIGSALAGKVPGLQVNATGGGVNPNYRLILRGQRSLLGNNQALIVLDNVIVPNSLLGNINPEDIEDLTVLNGAAAVALYGSDASNGALIVTTKRGRRGLKQFKLSNTYTFEQQAFLPQIQKKYGAGGNGYGVDAYGNPTQSYLENQSYGPEYDGHTYQLGPALEDGSVLMNTYSYKDDWKKFWQTGGTNQTDLAFTSGDDNSSFFFAGQYVDTKGTTPGDFYNRASVRLNGSKKIFNNLNFDYSTYYIQNRYDITSQTGTIYNDLLNMPHEVPVLTYKDWKNNPFANPNGYYNPWYGNPYFIADNNRQLTRNDYLTTSLILKYSPVNWLDITFKNGFTNQNATTKAWTGKFTYTAYAISSSSGSKSNIAGSESESYTYNLQLTSDLQASFHKKVKDFSLNALVATSLRQNKYKYIYTSISGLVVPDLYNLSNTLNYPSASNTDQTTRQQAIYGEFKIGYRNYLFLHVTGRNDWVSVLDPSHRSFFYPAADLSFIATDAIKSLRNIRGLDFLKFRGGVSKVGNVNVNPYSLLPTFGQANGYPYNGVAGYSVGSQIVANGLKPEFTKGWEAGFDFSLFKGFAAGGFTVYSTRTTNQTVPVNISYTTGYQTYLFNTGEVSNNGVEVKLNITPIQTNKWTLTVGTNYTYNDNEVVSINSSLPYLSFTNGSYAYAGKAFPVIMGTDYARDPKGRVIVDANTGLPQVNSATQILGNASTRDILSFDLTLSYKSFHFYALAEYRGGNKILNQLGSNEDWAGVSIRTAQYNRKRFVFPNSVYKDANGNYVENKTVVIQNGNGNDGFWTDATYNMGVTSNYVTSGAFWKLRQVSISYDLPTSLLAKTKSIKSATISVQGRNLFLWLPKSNIYTDPEYSANGSDSNGIGVTTLSSPPSRYYGATLTLTF